MIYLILFWLVILTAVVVILYLESRMKQETKEMWSIPIYTATEGVGVPSEVTYTKTSPQFVEFVGADRITDILSEKKDPKIDDILV